MDFLNLFNHIVNNNDKLWYGLTTFRGNDKRKKVKWHNFTTNGTSGIFSYNKVRYYVYKEGSTLWLKEIADNNINKYVHEQGCNLETYFK